MTTAEVTPAPPALTVISVLRALHDSAYWAWKGGLKRGGGGRQLSDLLTMFDLREIWQERLAWEEVPR